MVKFVGYTDTEINTAINGGTIKLQTNDGSATALSAEALTFQQKSPGSYEITQTQIDTAISAVTGLESVAIKDTASDVISSELSYQIQDFGGGFKFYGTKTVSGGYIYAVEGKMVSSADVGIGTFGGNAASSVLGGNNAGNVLSKITTWLATLFLSLAVVISVLTGPDDSSSSSLIKQEAENNPIQQVEEDLNTPIDEVLDLGGE